VEGRFFGRLRCVRFQPISARFPAGVGGAKRVAATTKVRGLDREFALEKRSFA
jgi:hypothetical protein